MNAARLAALLLAGLSLPASAATFSFSGVEAKVHGDFITGTFSDMALYASAGRERQFKVAQALIGADVSHTSSGWGALLELNLAIDEPKVDPVNKVYTDYYKNLGTDLYYYGDLPLRNAYLRYGSGPHTLRIGRMINIHGFDADSLPFWGRWSSPHMLFLDKGINTGIGYSFEYGGFSLDGFVFSGQDRPDRGGNFYSNGQTDPQIDGNSYPGYEMKASYSHAFDHARINTFVSYHHDKTGSAKGRLYHGKHNDERLALGVDVGGALPALGGLRWRLIAERALYQEGLTEDGAQGEGTPLESHDIHRHGYFVTAGLGYGRVDLYLTHEELDRADVHVWDEIARFDPEHPAMSAKETSTALQATVHINDYIDLVGLVRVTDNPFPQLSNLYPGRGDDRYAMYLRARF